MIDSYRATKLDCDASKMKQQQFNRRLILSSESKSKSRKKKEEYSGIFMEKKSQNGKDLNDSHGINKTDLLETAIRLMKDRNGKNPVSTPNFVWQKKEPIIPTSGSFHLTDRTGSLVKPVCLTGRKLRRQFCYTERPLFDKSHDRSQMTNLTPTPGLKLDWLRTISPPLVENGHLEINEVAVIAPPPVRLSTQPQTTVDHATSAELTILSAPLYSVTSNQDLQPPVGSMSIIAVVDECVSIEIPDETTEHLSSITHEHPTCETHQTTELKNTIQHSFAVGCEKTANNTLGENKEHEQIKITQTSCVHNTQHYMHSTSTPWYSQQATHFDRQTYLGVTYSPKGILRTTPTSAIAINSPVERPNPLFGIHTRDSIELLRNKNYPNRSRSVSPRKTVRFEDQHRKYFDVNLRPANPQRPTGPIMSVIYPPKNRRESELPQNDSVNKEHFNYDGTRLPSVVEYEDNQSSSTLTYITKRSHVHLKPGSEQRVSDFKSSTIRPQSKNFANTEPKGYAQIHKSTSRPNQVEEDAYTFGDDYSWEPSTMIKLVEPESSGSRGIHAKAIMDVTHCGPHSFGRVNQNRQMTLITSDKLNNFARRFGADDTSGEYETLPQLPASKSAYMVNRRKPIHPYGDDGDLYSRNLVLPNESQIPVYRAPYTDRVVPRSRGAGDISSEHKVVVEGGGRLQYRIPQAKFRLHPPIPKPRSNYSKLDDRCVSDKAWAGTAAPSTDPIERRLLHRRPQLGSVELHMDSRLEIESEPVHKCISSNPSSTRSFSAWQQATPGFQASSRLPLPIVPPTTSDTRREMTSYATFPRSIRPPIRSPCFTDDGVTDSLVEFLNVERSFVR